MSTEDRGPNPFATEATPAEWLVGQTAAKADLDRWVRDRVGVGVVAGPRGSGKTELTRSLLAGPSVHGVLIDVRDYVEPEDTGESGGGVDQLLRGIKSLLDRRFELPFSSNDVVAGRAEFLLSVLQSAARCAGGRLVVVLDEVDAITEQARTELLRIAAEASSPSSHGLLLFVYGEPWGSERFGAHPHVTRVGPLSADEVADLVDRVSSSHPRSFSSEAKAAVFEETRGFPLFVAGLLEQVYELRETEVTAAELAKAVQEFVARPPTRVAHALAQGGAVVARVLYALSHFGEDVQSLTRLQQRFAEEWPGAEPDLEPTLRHLAEAGLVSHAETAWGIAIPLLSRVVSKWTRDQADADDRPDPVAAEAWRTGEELLRRGDDEGALRRFAEAADADPRFWPARWSRARLLARADRTGGRTVADLVLAASLLRALEDEVSPRSANRTRIVAQHCRVLVELALRDDGGRSVHIDELRRLDPGLETPGARAVVKQRIADDWIAQIRLRAPGQWGTFTKETIRRHRSVVGERAIRGEMAARLEAELERAREAESFTLIVQYAFQVAWILLDAWMDEPPQGRDGDDAFEGARSLWGELARGLADAKVAGELGDVAALVPHVEAWRVLFDSPSQQVRRSIATTLGSAFAHELRTCVLDADAIRAHGLWHLAGSLRTRDALLRRISEDVLLGDLPSIFDSTPERMKAVGATVCIALAALAESADETDSVRLVTDSFAEAWAKHGRPVLRVDETTRQAWLALCPDDETGLVESLRTRPPDTGTADAPGDGDKQFVARVLGGSYQLVRQVPVLLPSLSSDAQRRFAIAFEATHAVDGQAAEQVLIRIFELSAPDPGTASVLQALWDRERRALMWLSVAREGRALMRYVDAHHDPATGRAAIVTRWVGSTTLRAVIFERGGAAAANSLFGGDAAQSRREAWRHVTWLLEAVGAIHRHGFIHRGISPEAVYVTEGSETGQRLVLGHFEWSVYLRGLQGLGGHSRHRALNRYVAPEALRSALGTGRVPSGEAFSSDTYSLGLLLFELFVRPLRDAELRSYHTPDSYGAAEEQEQARWIAELRQQTIGSELDEWEKVLLCEFLEFEMTSRPVRLHEIADRVREALDAATAYAEPLDVFTTLSSKLRDRSPAEDVRCVAFFLKRYLPEIARGDRDALRPAPLASAIERDLLGARVFANGRPSGAGVAPTLLVESRSGTLYRAEMMQWALVESDPKKDFPDCAYLTVARPHEGDAKTGSVLAVLRRGVEVHDIEPDTVAAVLGKRRSEARSWRALWQLATAAMPVADQDRQRRAARADTLSLLRLSVEVDMEASWHEYAFVRQDVHERVILRAPPSPPGAPARNLAEDIAALVEHDFEFEIAPARSQFGTGVTVLIAPEHVDLDSGTVEIMGRDTRACPQEGVIRPLSVLGSLALYHRRTRLIRQIQDDAYLLDAMARPQTRVERGEPSSRRTILELDEDKRAIVTRFLTTHPLLVVQGPPGTGKTTLAAELILQSLSRAPGTRILITSQGHDPLDNLLERLLSAGTGKAAKAQRIDPFQVVRLRSGNRLPEEYPEVVRSCLPETRAEAVFKDLRQKVRAGRRQPSIAGAVCNRLEAALSVFTSAPESLRRRIEESANIVFMTTGARALEAARPNSFDLVIVEEAARLVPIEILGALRLSRRWVLIGDHKQLPPFSYEVVRRGMLERIAADLGAEIAAQSEEVREELDRRYAATAARIDEFMPLFRHLHERCPGEHSATLQTQWRMHPDLGELVSREFYDGVAVLNPVGADLEKLRARTTHRFLHPVLDGRTLVWVEFDSAEADPRCAETVSAAGSIGNEAERRTLVALLRAVRATRADPSVAVLSPYRAQVEHLAVLLAGAHNWFEVFGTLDEKVHTVDSFQGRQAGTVVLSLVRNNTHRGMRQAVGFLAEKQRATVMFSRAEKLLVVLGCSAHFARFPETRWVGEIRRRAEKRGGLAHWLDLLPPSELPKLERR